MPLIIEERHRKASRQLLRTDPTQLVFQVALPPFSCVTKPITEPPTAGVSEAALAEAEHLKVDLRTQNWHDQPSFDARREIFHFEHVVPVSAIRAACCDQESERAVLAVLKGRLRVAWILKSEDAELTRLGDRSNRPDPDAAYRKAGIRLAPPRGA